MVLSEVWNFEYPFVEKVYRIIHTKLGRKVPSESFWRSHGGSECRSRKEEKQKEKPICKLQESGHKSNSKFLILKHMLFLYMSLSLSHYMWKIGGRVCIRSSSIQFSYNLKMGNIISLSLEHKKGKKIYRIMNKNKLIWCLILKQFLFIM